MLSLSENGTIEGEVSVPYVVLNGVVIGDVPSWRVDHMPYGGVKNSGLGREGIRYAIEDMTEIRLMVIRTPPEI